jgi:hypothetical protein
MAVVRAKARRNLAFLLAACVCTAVIGIRGAAEPQNDFHFSILGDRTGGAIPGIYGRVWREIDLLHPDFVINVGDTIEGGDDERAEFEWLQLRAIWDRYSAYPLYFTPGNHDIWSEASEKVYREQTGRPPSYSFSHQNAHFTVLDNSRTAELSEAQLDFLEADLKKHHDRRPKFVFFHKPDWLLHVKVRNRAFPLHQICRKYGVDYVISGHGHQFVRGVLEGVVYLEVGSSGGRLRGQESGQGFRQGWFFHHVWARVTGTKVEMTVKELDGAPGRGRMFRVEEWGEAGPGFDENDPALIENPR